MNNDTLSRNLGRMRDLLAGNGAANGRSVGLELERFLIDADGRTVPYTGERGVGALLRRLLERCGDAQAVDVDGHLMGLSYRAATPFGDVPVAVSLEPAAQVEVSAGPASCAEALFCAIESFDRDVEGALRDMGLDARLVALGYNPTVSSPLDLELIPKERYRHMDAYLSRHGGCARDMMRATASTQVSLDYGDERDAMALLRRAEVLGPFLAFLFDNAPVFRGAPTPGMARSRIWRDMDPDRCGTVPGSLGDFGFDAYARWVAGVRPILFTDEAHVTAPTGDRTAADIMSERKLTDAELAHLMSMVFPNVRLKGFLELREMDSLPPRLAAACASFSAAVLYRDADALGLPFDLASVREDDVERARLDLEDRGWDARPYGVPVAETMQALLGVAEAAADSGFDRESAAILRDMWEARELPRTRAAHFAQI